MFPFFVGLIIGITAISATCEEYNKVRSALRWIPTFFVIDTAADIMGSETVQSVYQKVAKFIPNLSLHLFMNYARFQSQFDELCVGQDATYSPSSVGVGGGEGYMDCPDDTLSVVAKSSSLISLINQNMDVYRRAAAATNVPWEALAAIHYREASLNPGRSLGSGERLGSASPDQKRVLGSSLYETAVWAGKHLQSKVGGRLTQDMTDGELLKDAFFGYNGRAKSYARQATAMGFDKPYEGSPYVMNNFDAKHKNMGIITRDYGGIDGKDTRDGAYTVFVLLRNGKFDESGRVTSLGYCKPVVPSDGGGIKEVVGDGGPMGQRLIQIAQSYIGKITKYSQSRRTSFSAGYADCSSFVSKVLQDAGLPTGMHWTGSMADSWDSGKSPYVKPVMLTNRYLTPEEMGRVQPGDIIIWGGAHSNNAHTAIITSTTANEFKYIDVTSRNGSGAQHRARSRTHRTVWGIYRAVET
ncbi:MAG TPA: CHAP domain-containing protein [bacterium]|nr:CHAP domain-containing protein [bacterium]HOR57684.1 CHAP domain-containing protein [bacterium]HPL56455.1 CHAP domain-containing protein [bacterium]